MNDLQAEEATVTDDQLFRANPEYAIELRVGGDGRTVSGIAVPYNTPQRINAHLMEGFLPGSFARQAAAPSRVPLARDHLPLGGKPIGKVTLMREDAAGLYVEARVSNTPLGNDTLELLNDGVLSNWSIGFREGQNQMRGATTWRKTATMTELAIVNRGAYGDAASVLAVREALEDEHLECPHCAALALREASTVDVAELIRSVRPLPLPPMSRRLA